MTDILQVDRLAGLIDLEHEEVGESDRQRSENVRGEVGGEGQYELDERRGELELDVPLLDDPLERLNLPPDILQDPNISLNRRSRHLRTPIKRSVATEEER